MNNCVTRRALTIPSVFLLLFISNVLVPANTFRDEGDEIVGVWRWDWTNNEDYPMKDCPAGSGTMTATEGKSISFKGKYRQIDGSDVEISESGSWEYVGKDPDSYNRRQYRLHWTNDTDTIVMADTGNFLRGTNGSGKCIVTGSRQSAN
jgi:hypothetical protein